MIAKLKKNSYDLGIKLGTILFVVSALIYMYDLKFFYNGVQSLACVPIMLGFGIYSIYKNKKLQNEIISFKESFTAYFLCIVIGYFIASIGDLLIFKFIDPEAGKIINEELMIQQKQMGELLQQASEDISKQLDDMQKYPRFSYRNIFLNYMVVLVINAIIGVFPALIFKKT
ncbi:MAG: hypothetical protein CMC51_04425 [Flavobacteriaceae bacterium]|nr:hypothetical protein [Flavobacteriaceae bacterium]|tara:strand:- start:61986 stop:62501 length:516 start_codon:yes stop_codon:yes gene_type:complete